MPDRIGAGSLALDTELSASRCGCFLFAFGVEPSDKTRHWIVLGVSRSASASVKVVLTPKGFLCHSRANTTSRTLSLVLWLIRNYIWWLSVTLIISDPLRTKTFVELAALS